jgi:hypothetical protein
MTEILKPGINLGILEKRETEDEKRQDMTGLRL